MREKTPFTVALARVTERHGNGVIVVALALAALSLYGVSRLKVENSFVDYFSDDTEIHQGLKLIDEKLGGSAPLDVVLKFDPAKGVWGTLDQGCGGRTMMSLPTLMICSAISGKQNRIRQIRGSPPTRLIASRPVHEYLEGFEAVGKVQSLASALYLAEELNDGEEFDAFELAIINKKMPPEIKTDLFDPYISIPDNEARVTLRVQDSFPDLRRKEFLQQLGRRPARPAGPVRG